MDNWKYKYGEFEINTPFTRPTHSLFSSWRTQFLSQVDLSNFNVMFMGNAAERIYGISTIATIDIDIILSGEIDSYKNLSNILRTGFKIGLEQNLCIDIFHLDIDIMNVKEWGEYNQIRFYDKIEINNKQPKYIKNKIEDLPYGLYKFHGLDSENKSHKKHKDRIKTGQYRGLRFNLKTMRLISYN
jgi:hypothetical protein